MTREEAIAELSVLHERLSNPKDCEDGCYSWEDGWYVEAIDMAIEALSAEAEEYEDYEHATLVDIKAPLRASAEAVQGEWKIDEYGIYHCPYCHAINNTVYKNFCPNCGAKMKGADHETD